MSFCQKIEGESYFPIMEHLTKNDVLTNREERILLYQKLQDHPASLQSDDKTLANRLIEVLFHHEVDKTERRPIKAILAIFLKSQVARDPQIAAHLVEKVIQHNLASAFISLLESSGNQKEQLLKVAINVIYKSNSITFLKKLKKQDENLFIELMKTKDELNTTLVKSALMVAGKTDLLEEIARLAPETFLNLLKHREPASSSGLEIIVLKKSTAMMTFIANLVGTEVFMSLLMERFEQNATLLHKIAMDINTDMLKCLMGLVSPEDFTKLLDLVDGRGHTPLHSAAANGLRAFVRVVWNDNKENVQALLTRPNNNGETLFFLIAKHRNLQEISEEIYKQSSIFYLPAIDQAIAYCSSKGNLKELHDFLIERHPDSAQKEHYILKRQYIFPLLEHIKNNQLDQAVELINKACNELPTKSFLSLLNSSDIYNISVLTLAIQKKKIELIECIANQLKTDFVTLLNNLHFFDLALEPSNDEVVQCIFKIIGASHLRKFITQIDSNGDTPLHRAASLGRQPFLKFIWENFRDDFSDFLSIENSKGESLFFLIANSPEQQELLEEIYAQPEQFYLAPLDRAISYCASKENLRPLYNSLVETHPRSLNREQALLIRRFISPILRLIDNRKTTQAIDGLRKVFADERLVPLVLAQDVLMQFLIKSAHPVLAENLLKLPDGSVEEMNLEKRLFFLPLLPPIWISTTVQEAFDDLKIQLDTELIAFTNRVGDFVEKNELPLISAAAAVKANWIDLEGDSEEQKTTEVGNFLRNAPYSQLAMAAKSSPELIKNFLPFMEPQQLSVVIPQFNESQFVLILKESKVGLNLAYMRSATESQLKAAIECLDEVGPPSRKVSEWIESYPLLDESAKKLLSKDDSVLTESLDLNSLESRFKSCSQSLNIEIQQKKAWYTSLNKFYSSLKGVEKGVCSKIETSLAELEKIAKQMDQLRIQIEQLTAKSIPNEFYCPITLDLMEEPVLAEDGKNYERSAIEGWIKSQNPEKPILSPVTRAKISLVGLKDNIPLKKLIESIGISQKLVASGDQIEAALRGKTLEDSSVEGVPGPSIE